MIQISPKCINYKIVSGIFFSSFSIFIYKINDSLSWVFENQISWGHSNLKNIKHAWTCLFFFFLQKKHTICRVFLLKIFYFDEIHFLFLQSDEGNNDGWQTVGKPSKQTHKVYIFIQIKCQVDIHTDAGVY